MERLRNFPLFRISDLIATLAYILMDNFYPCFLIQLSLSETFIIVFVFKHFIQVYEFLNRKAFI